MGSYTSSQNVGRGALAGIFAAGLVGCAAGNASNPTLSLTGAEVSGDRATLGVRIENPSDRDVTVEEVSWTLIYGPLPVAEGVWRLGQPLPSGGAYDLTRTVRFSGPPVDPSSGEIELTGEMELSQDGGGQMGFESASFSGSAPVRKR